LAGLILLASVALITLLLTAFGSGSNRAVQTAAPAPATRLLPAGPPRPQVVALQGSIRLLLPVAQGRLTAVGYHAAADGALELRPVGRQLNQGIVGRVARSLFGSGSGAGLRYYVLDGGTGPATASLDIGAPPGTDVYSPVDGTVVSISDYVIDGKAYGSRIDVRPTAAPSLIVTLIHVQPDPSIAVGSAVLASSSKLGSVVDVAAVERQALAKHARARGNNVSIDVHPAAGSLP